MRLCIYILALVLYQSSTLCSAYPPTYSGEPSIVGDSGGGGGGNIDYGGSIQKQPNLGAYKTTSSSTKSGGTLSSIYEGADSSLNMKHPATTTAKTTTTATATATATAIKVLTTNSSTQAAPAPASSSTVVVRMQPAFAYEATIPTHKESVAVATNNKNNLAEIDGDASKKIIGSNVVTSVSVILNGDKPQFTDALGHKVPKPLPSLQVASPINLLNPDRYEFYTFDDNGELVKRLMTMQEIQSIVANGDGEGPSIIHTPPVNETNPEKNVQDIVNSVQSVLNKEVESTKNASVETTLPVLDTPDVSSSWSLILPAIFGNTGGDIFPQQKPQQIVMTPDSELLETSTKSTPATRATKKPKPSKRKPGHKRKPTTTTTTALPTPQVVQEELDPNESVYTGLQQYQNLASMQNFDAFSTMNMQPIYHKQPSEAATETTTRRVFVNNQEMIQTTSEMRPATSTVKTPTTELTENLAKKPAGVNTKHTPPHRNKTPNNGSQTHTSKRPSSTGHTKQKVKKKPTPAPTATTPESISTTEPTTPAPSTTTTSTTTLAPTTTIAPSTTAAPTTQKKKKKKPTRQPGQKPQGLEKLKPNQRPKPAHKPQQQVEQQQQYAEHNKHRPANDNEAASTVQQEATQQFIHVNHHKQRPRPTTSTTTSTTTTTTTTTTPTSTVEETPEAPLIVLNSPTYSPDTYNIVSNSPFISSVPSPAYPVPSYDASLQQAHPTSDYISEDINAANLKKKPLPSLSQIQQLQQTTKPAVQEMHQKPAIQNEPPLQKPIYQAQTETSQIHKDTVKPMQQPTYSLPEQPSYQMPELPKLPTEIKQQITLEQKPQASTQPAQLPQSTYHQTQEEAQRPAIDEDQNTKLSFDQIMQSLQSEIKEAEKPQTQQPSIDNKETSKITGIMPTKYDSAESIDKLEEIANKKKKPVLFNSVAPHFPVTTTMVPLTAHYGGSTLSTMLSEETSEALTSRPFTQAWSTDSASTEDTTTTSSEELNTPVVIITARPQYLVTTKRTDFIPTTMPERLPLPHESETTGIPPYGQVVETTIKEEEQKEAYNPTTIREPETDATVANFQPLYADIKEPIVTEITTEAPTPINNYNEDETSNTESASDKESLAVTTESSYDLQKIGMARLPVTLPQKIDTLIAVGDDTTEQPTLVANLKPHLNLDVLRPTEQIAMSEFQTQAATVASTLVDGTNTVASDSFMSSNETKDELAFLMNDVIKQIANDEQQSYKLQPVQEDTNRLTNFAQLNSSFLLKPIQASAAADKQKIAASVFTHSGTASTLAMDSTTKSTSHIVVTQRPTEQVAKTETIYQPVTVIQAPHYTTAKPQHIAEKPANPVDNDKPDPVYQINTDTKPPAIAMIDKDKPDPIYKPPAAIKIPEILFRPIEATTIIPSKEEIIKKEEEYLSSVLDKTTDAPEEIMEATTFMVPVLSLSQIYAQQQQEEDDKEALYEAEREKLNAAEVIPEIDNKTTEDTVAAPTTAKEEDEELTATMTNSYETSDERETTEEISGEGESSEKASSEKESTESVPSYAVDEKLEETATTQASEPAKGTYAEMINANKENNEKKSTEQLYATMINQSEESSTEKQSTEAGYATMINGNEEQKVQSTEENYTSKIQTAEEAYAVLSEINNANVESNEKLPAFEYDSITNAAHPQPEFAQSPMAEYSTDKQEVTETYAPAAEQSEYGNLPDSTEIPGVTAVVYTDSDMVGSSEQNAENTEASTEKQSTELSNETSEDLSATISEEDPEQPAEPEDPYIKLGEITNKPATTSVIAAAADKDDKPTYSLPELVKPIEEQAKEPELLQNTYGTIVAAQQPVMPAFNYGQAPEQEDEEDEDDQAPAILQSSSSTTTSSTTTTTARPTTRRTTTTRPIAISTTKRLNTLKPVSYYKQPSFTAYNQAEQPPKVPIYSTASNLPVPMPPQQRPMQRPAALSNLMHSSTQATRPPVKLEPSPADSKGLEASIANLDEDVLQFARLCNELAFSYWKSITSEKISSARSLIISPFALTSMLSMVFLGARGGTSGEMNEVLKLDDMVTFNPHLVFKNITESVEKAPDSDIATTAFVREVFSDRANGKILQFFKEKTQQLYAGHVEEVNFHVVNDIIRRRTNLLVKRHTMGKVLEYLRTNSVWVNGPLATISANLFQTDCSRGSTHDRDGEMFFQVHPSVRQRRLIPIPAVLYKNGFTAGYEPKLDATVVAFGRIEDTVSTIYLMPGHQSSISPTDNLDRLEKELVEMAFSENAWSNVLTSLMDRPDMEVQLPRFSHRSFVNASLGLQKMGLKGLFKSDLADLRGLTGSSNRDIYLSDMIQINTFSTCGEDKISDHHHVEMYPAPPLRKRNKDVDANEDDEFDSSESIIDFGSLVHESALGRGFYDDLLDPKFLELPLPLRPRQARVPDSPRLRFDKPFLYFVRHNPTGMILFMGRFNPRLLP